jgi:hypothetical protein
MATGLGSPDAASLAQTMCAMALQVSNPGDQSTTVHEPVKLQITATDAGGTGLAYKTTGLPAGLAINAATGVISGKPKRITTAHVTVYVADVQSVLGRASFNWSIGGLPGVSHASLSGLRQARPKLAFTISAGRNAPALSSLSIGPAHGLRFSSARKLTVKSAGKRIAHSASVKHGTLSIKLPKPASSLQVTVAYASLTASNGLVHHPPRRLKLAVKPTDASGTTTTVAFEVKP